MQRIRAATLGLVCALALTACSDDRDQAEHDRIPPPPEIIPQLAASHVSDLNAAPEVVSEDLKPFASAIAPDAFAQAMQVNGARVIDVRTPAEFAQGAIRGAENIPLDTFKATDLAATGAGSQDKPLLLYCRSGRRSAQALALLEAAGVKGAVHLEGGILAWQRSGYAVKRP